MSQIMFSVSLVISVLQKKKKKSGGGGLLGQIHLEYASCYKIFRNSQYILRYYVLQDGLQSPLFTPEY